jgi:hypothetical protein
VTLLERNRAAWLGSLAGIAALTGETLTEVAAEAGPPPYATPGDGEAEYIAALAAKLDGLPPANDAEDSEDEGDGEDGAS